MTSRGVPGGGSSQPPYPSVGLPPQQGQPPPGMAPYPTTGMPPQQGAAYGQQYGHQGPHPGQPPVQQGAPPGAHGAPSYSGPPGHGGPPPGPGYYGQQPFHRPVQPPPPIGGGGGTAPPPPPIGATGGAQVGRGRTDDKRAAAEAAFRRADTDGSGQLDAREFIRMLQGLGTGLSEADCMAIFGIADRDGDWSITRDEFLHLYAANF
eukprot:TRINITY_DN6697_c1_g1_i1.p1 TRINITY_DN6697_c1_g1~~TRINITY_DN6697_c1_g1_i1.p1  ORF type:complete len:207 (+),score=20.21 TRINITY_DN6697_c1_g1_i1:101-721(+)